MRWEGGRQSTNVEDVRGSGGGGRRGLGIGCGGMVLVIIFALVTGRNPLQLLQTIQETQGGSPAQTVPSGDGTTPAPDQEGKFVGAVLGNTEDVWTKLLANTKTPYQDPHLVRFSGSIPSQCGMASAAVGPFYCPADQKVYLDTAFFDELSQRFGAPGKFAEAYVVAHEIGHHVQNLLGIDQNVRDAQERARDDGQANELSVKMELQADCLAGVWAYHADHDYNMIEPGDFESGLKAAQAIGDDEIQKQTQGYVVPESFTHGTAAQRSEWLRRGLQSGDPNDCDTFAR